MNKVYYDLKHQYGEFKRLQDDGIFWIIKNNKVFNPNYNDISETSLHIDKLIKDLIILVYD